MSGNCLVHGGVSGPSGMEGSRLSGLSLDACCEEVRPEAGLSSPILSELKPSWTSGLEVFGLRLNVWPEAACPDV